MWDLFYKFDFVLLMHELPSFHLSYVFFDDFAPSLQPLSFSIFVKLRHFFLYERVSYACNRKVESLIEPMGDDWLQFQIRYYMFALFLLFLMLKRSFFTMGNEF
ncbi:hypothetical protein MtrunA17_Chr5g0408091 [Medicago truncatula]|uniref:Transmembrane protein n=1 Tax=Medicago truncatula TaxID=3880 RepID=A0A396HQ02_MEDTR|nr:hypothetical protein MtrunA17_Chr5g0408091 [Medicago truncatula]